MELLFLYYFLWQPKVNVRLIIIVLTEEASMDITLQKEVTNTKIRAM